LSLGESNAAGEFRRVAADYRMARLTDLASLRFWGKVTTQYAG
jgi:hypothetical protein